MNKCISYKNLAKTGGREYVGTKGGNEFGERNRREQIWREKREGEKKAGTGVAGKGWREERRKYGCMQQSAQQQPTGPGRLGQGQKGVIGLAVADRDQSA